MISKIVTYAPTRQEAIDHMEKALDEYVIDGITHNTPLLREILGNKRLVYHWLLVTGYLLLGNWLLVTMLLVTVLLFTGYWLCTTQDNISTGRRQFILSHPHHFLLQLTIRGYKLL